MLFFKTPRRICIVIHLPNHLTVTSSDSVRNLGIYLDKGCCMKHCINFICKTYFFEHRRISAIAVRWTRTKRRRITVRSPTVDPQNEPSNANPMRCLLLDQEGVQRGVPLSLSCCPRSLQAPRLSPDRKWPVTW